ncbi:MAG TPA: kelch repeat-containing protein [Flavobacteriales bacterium]|nr:kelch repeat-containing protein [Flavobacteriales bacterium]
MYLRLAIFLLLLGPGLAQAQWTALSDWPGNGFDGGYSFVLGDQVYVGFGQQLQRYDPPTNLWTARAAFPGPGSDRKWANAFVIGDRAYVGMGIIGNSTFQTDLWAYDPVSDSWSARASLPAAARGGSATFVLDGIGYVCGGTSTGPTFSEVFAYDPTADSWSQVSDLPTGPRGFPAAFALNGKGYVYGGYQSGFTNETSEVHRFDPISATWEQVADLPGVGRQSAVAAMVNGIPVVAMGHRAFTLGYNNLYSYDLSTDTWSLLTQFPGGDRVYPVCAAIDGTFFLGLGNNFSFTPQRDWWSYAMFTAVHEVEQRAAPIVFPNPAHNRIRITLSADESGLGELCMLDARGRIVASRTLNILNDQVELDISNLTQGYYWIQIKTTNSLYRQAFIVDY